MRVYELFLNDELKDGINAISVVGEPAMESQFVALKKNEKKQTFAKVDEKKKILMGIIMKPNKKIFRFDEETKEEFEVFFSEQTVRRASELYFKNNKHNNFNVEHNSEDLLEAYLVESWIVEDVEKDKSAVYNLGAEVGDWVGTMKFDSEEQYNKALESGTGFSLEGIFSEKVILNKVKNMEVDFKKLEDGIFDRIKGLFKKEVKLAQANLKDGAGTIEFDGEMPMAGGTINLVTPDGNVPAPAGEYILEDDSTIVVTEIGVIAEVKAVEPMSVEPTPATAPTSLDQTGQLKDMISSILVKFGEDLEAKLTTKIDAKFSENAKAVEDLKVELSLQPAVEKTNVAPTEKSSSVELKAMTKEQRIQYALNQVKN